VRHYRGKEDGSRVARMPALAAKARRRWGTRLGADFERRNGDQKDKADKSQGIVVFKMGHGSKKERDVFTISLYLL
jgi:hypothetical protein